MKMDLEGSFVHVCVSGKTVKPVKLKENGFLKVKAPVRDLQFKVLGHSAFSAVNDNEHLSLSKVKFMFMTSLVTQLLMN